MEENSVVEDQYADAKSCIEKLQEDIHDLRITLDDRSETIETLEIDLAKKSDTIKVTEEEAKTLREEVSSLTISNNEAESTIEDLKKKCSVSEEGMASAKKSLEEQGDNISKLGTQLSEEKGKNALLTEQITAVKTSMSKLSSEYEIITSVKNELELKCRMFEDNIGKSDKKVSEAQNLAEAREEKLLATKEDLNAAKESLVDKEEKMRTLLAQISCLESEVSKMKDAYIALESNKIEQDSKYITLQDSLHTAHSDLSSAQELAEDRERHIFTLKEEIHNLSNKLQGVMEENSVVEDQYADAKSCIEKLQEDIHDLRITLDDRSETIETLEIDLAKKSDTIKVTEEEAKTLREEVSSLTISNNEAESTIEDLKKKCSVSEEGMASAKKSLEEQGDNISKLGTQLSEEKGKNALLTEQITAVKTSMSKLSSEYEIITSVKNELELKCRMFEDNIGKSDKKVSEAQNLAEAREEKLLATKEDLNAAKESLVDKEEKMRTLLAQISCLESKVAELEIACDEETFKASQSQDIIASQVHELKLSKEKEEQLSNEIDTIRQKLNDSFANFKSKDSIAETRKKALELKCAALEESIEIAQRKALAADESAQKYKEDLRNLEVDLEQKSTEIAKLSFDVKQNGELLKQKSEWLQYLHEFSLPLCQKYQISADHSQNAGENEIVTLITRIIDELEIKNGLLSAELGDHHLQVKTKSYQSMCAPNDGAKQHQSSRNESKDDSSADILMSPMTASLLSKHDDMLSDLSNMKNMMVAALSSDITAGTSHSSDSRLENDELKTQLKEKDKLLESMRKNIDSLAHDLSLTRRDLDQQLVLVDKMAHSNTNMRSYIDGVEKALGRELALRRLAEEKLRDIKEKIESEAKEDGEVEDQNDEISKMKNGTERSSALMKAGASRLIFQILDRKAKAQMGRAFRQWVCTTREGAVVSSQINVAREMAHQLETTKQKLEVLKSYFNDNCAVEQEVTSMQDILSPNNTPQSLVRLSDPNRGQTLNNSSFWDVSDDDASLNDSHIESIDI